MGGDGVDHEICVVEAAGMGTIDGLGATTPYLHPPPGSEGKSAGKSFASALLFNGKGHLPRLVAYPGEEEFSLTLRGTAADSG